jgi:hypothetical protein
LLRGMFTMLLHSNSCGANHVENIASIVEEEYLPHCGHVFTKQLLRIGLHNPVLLSWALHGNDRCLQSDHIATGLMPQYILFQLFSGIDYFCFLCIYLTREA